MTVDQIGYRDSARRKGALHQQTTNRLRKMIVSGELAPGERLRESYHCKVFEVSRTPFREAVKSLAAEGLIELSPNRSPSVARIHAGDLRHLYAVVASLEALAGEEACSRVSEQEIAELIGLHSQMLASFQLEARAEYLRLNHRIHRRVVEIAGNPILLSSWEALVPRVERARAVANLSRERWLAAVSEHSKMLSALVNRDGESLAALTRAHFANGLDYSQKYALRSGTFGAAAQ